MEDVSSTGSVPQNGTSIYRQMVSIIGEHAVIYSDKEIYTLCLRYLDGDTKFISCPRPAGWNYPVFSLSSDPTRVVGISDGSEAYIFDLDSHHLKHIIPGIGRTITSLSLCKKGARSIATGHIDGSICIWNLANLERPLERLSITGQACDALELSVADPSYLASLHGGDLYIRCFEGTQWRTVHEARSGKCRAFAWHPRITGLLALASTDGELCMYNLASAAEDPSVPKSSEESDDESDGGVFEPPDGIKKDLQPISKVDLETPLTSLSWASDRNLVGLAEGGQLAFVHGTNDDGHGLTQLWSCKFENRVGAVQLLSDNGAASIVGVDSTRTIIEDVPDDVAKTLHSDEDRSAPTAASDGEARAGSNIHTMLSVLADESHLTGEIRSSPGMNPVSISSQQRESASFVKTSRQLQHMRRMSRLSKKFNGPSEIAHSDADRTATSRSPPTLAEQEEADVPIFETEDDLGSPMPFLSPSIPSTRTLLNDIPLLGDSALTPPKPRHRTRGLSIASEPDAPVIGADTDDSDDETFIDDMHGSATFLPGGINVPLPKACGALFASNGQLLTFFPPKPRLATINRESTNEIRAEKASTGDRTAKLFPSFGNLELASDSGSEDSDSDKFNALERGGMRLNSLPKFNFQPASFQSEHSWKPRDVDAHPAVYTEQPRHRIIVNVHEIADVPSLHPQQRNVAAGYRLLCNGSQTGSELCEYNAAVAEAAGLNEVTEIWQLLAMLLRGQVPLDILSDRSTQNDIFIMARQATSLAREDSGIGLSRSGRSYSVSSKMQWADHPFGGTWLVRRILAWAEERADMQSLACFCAVLSEAERRPHVEKVSMQHSMLTHLPTYSHSYVTEAKNTKSEQENRQVIPILRTHSATITSLHESPTKIARGGELSSSLTSQMSLNHSDSSLTPPFPSPLLSRQSTRLSASGSSSPEFQRGSFSTAAKYYAQSLSEKFLYGSSPPAKKADTSPTTSAELSTSLPGGSWPSKSVSFASTTTGSSTQRSLSVSVSRTDIVEDAGYDSDKTIEDSSLPLRTKRGRSNVALKLNNREMLAEDESCEIARAKLMPDDLVSQIAIWNPYYAEQLRSWEMLVQASELEKVFGITAGNLQRTECMNGNQDGLVPKVVSGQRKPACAICLLTMKGVMQICPACLHSSHLHCLEEFCQDLPEAEFICPSGCGCSCEDLPFVVQEISKQSSPRPQFKKKASFTDPRRWRARVEGDSW